MRTFKTYELHVLPSQVNFSYDYAPQLPSKSANYSALGEQQKLNQMVVD
jgi:hypothetical protein